MSSRGRGGNGPSPRPSSSTSSRSTSGRSGTPSSTRGRGRGRNPVPTPSPPHRRHRLAPAAAFSGAQGLFGGGAGAVSYEKDGRDGTWKVGPSPGQRFQLTSFLEQLSAFVAWQFSGTTAAATSAADTDGVEATTYSTRTSMTTASESVVDSAVAALINDEEADTASSSGTRSLTECIAATSISETTEVTLIQALKLSLRLERRDLSDSELGLVADWAAAHCDTVAITKLWLFGARVTDGGALHVARMLTPATTEVHLSHNMLTLEGAVALLEAVAVSSRTTEHTPLWLRLEWNRISLPGLVTALERLHAAHGLLVDVPQAATPGAAPPLPTLPGYLTEARRAAVPSPARGGGLQKSNALRPILAACHVRLPWASCQYELPSEAAVLQTARSLWQRSSNSGGGSTNTGGVAAGPLLLITDTSALLSMAGADPKMCIPTPFTLERLRGLADAGLFGRALPEQERIVCVVPDSVMKQLDGLKGDSGAKAAVRRFMSKGLDECGPAGANFLTILGAHEGEGLILDRDVEGLAGSSNVALSKGQAADARIVEVALFFQHEIINSSNPDPAAEGTQGGIGEAAQALPVILLSGDNGQIALAKAHGLPAIRMSHLAATLGPHFEKGPGPTTPLSATWLREVLRDEAVRGLGAVAARSLQSMFDQTVGCLRQAVEVVEAQRAMILELQGLRAAPVVADTAKIGENTHEGCFRESAVDTSSRAEALLGALRVTLEEAEGLVVSRQAGQQRLLQWTNATAGATH